MNLAACTGIRYVEAVNAYNLTIQLSRQQRLREYYDADKQLLEHYNFKDLFIRRSKKVFVSFTPEDLVEEVGNSIPLTKNAIQNRIKRAGIKSKLGDLREYWATTMTKTLRQPEIDFLPGRVSSSVFMRHYFNPAWITDLKTRTLRTCEEVLAQI